MPSAEPPTGTNAPSIGFLHREILQLVVLIVVAVGAFFLTRAIAASNHAMNLQHGVEWYEEGQRLLAAGDREAAIDAFRRATVRNRNEKRYALALAGALADAGRNEIARGALLRLRESAPEDPDINLQLAQLAAARQDVAEAVRYYHNTLYAPWAPEQAAVRRGIRLALILFLLDQQRVGAALSEIVALSTELPDDADAYAGVGQLFARAGDHRRALDAFETSIRLSPEGGEGLEGAGRASFAIGNYALARTYLRAASARGRDVGELLEIVDLVRSRDPLASRIGTAARHQRLASTFAYAQGRLHDCLDGPSVAAPLSVDQLGLRIEADTFGGQLTDNRTDALIERGVELVARIARVVPAWCPPPTPLDRALVLIGRLHGAGTP